MSEEERRILIVAIAEGIAKRVGMGSGFSREKDLPWLEERVLRMLELLKEMK